MNFSILEVPSPFELKKDISSGLNLKTVGFKFFLNQVYNYFPKIYSEIQRLNMLNFFLKDYLLRLLTL